MSHVWVKSFPSPVAPTCAFANFHVIYVVEFLDGARILVDVPWIPSLNAWREEMDEGRGGQLGQKVESAYGKEAKLGTLNPDGIKLLLLIRLTFAPLLSPCIPH